MSKASREIREALDTLNLPTFVSREDIRSQYLHLAKTFHPDQGGTDADMEKINRAYKLLMKYIDSFRYSFDEDEINRQIPGSDYADRFKF